MMDESSRLLILQQQLEKEVDGKAAFYGLSVNETIRICIINGMPKRADKIKSDFKVPDKRQVFMAYRSLVRSQAEHTPLDFGTSSCTLLLRSVISRASNSLLDPGVVQ